MPTEKDVDERHAYWCPKWYWPFAICHRTERVHKWCYEFSWVKETGYGILSHLEGCEGGTLYTWWSFSFNLFGGSDLGPGQLCFDSPRTRGGPCAR